VRNIAIACAFLGMALTAPVHADGHAGQKSYAPRDECRSVPGAAAFLDSLAAAVKARDADALVALAAPDIHLDFGGGEGRDELRDRLVNGGEYYGDLWKELGIVLSLGCASEGDGMIALPWYFTQDFGEADAFSTMLAMGPDVKVRASAADDARVIASLNWSTVEVPGDYDVESKFTEVELQGMKRGYVETGKLRSLIDYRLVAERRDEGWRITAFIAGD
jgi:hypothetical protein